MEVLIQKYGGTSVANAERIKIVANRIVETAKTGKKLVVVVSAPAGMTDSLIGKAKEISKKPNGRELDMILATGEQLSISLLALAIQELGENAISFTAPQIGILTESVHTKARIKNIPTEKLRAKLEQGSIVIIAGFQGVTDDNEITTLGRGGSDITATALGCALNAAEVEIYTDVDGVYTADPRVVPKAKKIPRISYEEMLEMAGSGARFCTADVSSFRRSITSPSTCGVHSTIQPEPIFRKERPLWKKQSCEASPIQKPKRKSLSPGCRSPRQPSPIFSRRLRRKT